MTITENKRTVEKPVEYGLNNRIFQMIGGRPVDFHRITSTPVGLNNIRVNVYVEVWEGECRLVPTYRIAYSLFLSN